jgi:hypothetical protein
MHNFLKPVLAATAVALILSAGPALAELLNLKAELTGASEVPPADTAGTGTVEATFDTDTKVFTWTINYEGLSGNATAAHFHGPAPEDGVADPVVPIEGDLTSPINGNATLDDQQATDLQGGAWYFNIHTEKYPDGELRGQVMKAEAM